MSKRRINNILKRKLSLNLKKMFSEGSVEGLEEMKKEKGEWVRSQFRDFSKLGGELVVMKMGN